jgi:glycosyltransferase involved in cell wall biosynthesis
MRILASPARRNRAANPFNFLLSEALAADGCEVVDLDGEAFSRWDVFRLRGRWDVFHIHWPQNYARSLKGVVVLSGRLAAQRLKGARIVWTVHNVLDHDQQHPRLERILMWFVARLVHGLIFLTPSSRVAAYERIPGLKAKPYAVIPHGLYGERSQKTRDESRALFKLPRDGLVVGFFGDIRQYKGLDVLLDAFADTRPGQATLFIAGAFADAAYGTKIRARLSVLTTAGHSVVFREERIDNATLVDAVRACDLVALPYRAAWNSGLAILVLENRGRILASSAPVFRELQHKLGPKWVETFDERLTGEKLLTALERKSDGDADRLKTFCESRSWSEISAATIAFYKRLGAH